MRLHETLDLPLEPAAVAAMYADPRYAEIRARGLRASRTESSHTGDPAGAFTVTTVLEMPTNGVPDVARPFVGSSISVREEQTWQAPGSDGTRTGRTVMTVAGAPASMTADLRLEPDGSGTRITIDGELVAKVPLIGGRIEKAAVPYISKVLRAEERAAHEYAESAGSAGATER